MTVGNGKRLVALSWVVLFGVMSYFGVISAAQAKSVKMYPPNPPISQRVQMLLRYDGGEKQEELEIGIELYGSVVPDTVKNFREIAKGVKAKIKGTDQVLDITYKNTVFHRVVPEKYICGGKVLDYRFSIHGQTFKDENFDIKHDRPGRLAMVNDGPDSNHSQFYIVTSLEPLEENDGKNVVFGQVYDGLEELLEKVRHLPLDEQGKPTSNLKIVGIHVDDLSIQNMDELVALYKQSLVKYHAGDTSVGVPETAFLRKGAGENGAVISSFEYSKQRVVVFGLVFALLYIAAKRGRSYLASKANVVSVRNG
ncbi:AAR045Cp [Eremothecium gossypii ATCC 10895]|uniref:AAR045Cp n=1 Tax=Eremothecium gossypii (strain ATCC 10895 / CBS 109.51 / FGSC 9923 / NRRL Y-1056) TaxID=284811 RepID=Q75EN4_EREGS|nr:AAR045Cp [Eremothecium gossypii ATCC 10895]AAS50410.1 AAR045Cp [Eremothecium gossypii ATCC 10895]AEY94696.1 FAAR045Cp [Eremothecium gossypii FDAG1]